MDPLKETACCPWCRGALTWDEAVGCASCGRAFARRSGILSFVEEQPAPPDPSDLELSVLILARNEGPNLGRVLSELNQVLRVLQVDCEVLVVDGGSTDNTVATAEAHGAVVHRQQHPGYGNAFREGLALCRGRFIITVDADGSHDPHLVTLLWKHREAGELVVASRYCSRGEAWMPLERRLLSQLLNRTLRRALSIPVQDLSSGFRLYRREAMRDVDLVGRDFDILIELLVKMVLEGHRVHEIPLLFKPRAEGRSKVRLGHFAISYLRSTWRLWRTRNSIEAADYDSRAYHSVIPPQRYWQRRRYDIIMGFLEGAISGILDVGCGSSKIIQSLPGAVGLDTNLKKLRYLRPTNPWLAHGSVFSLPFRDASFSVVVCSQVIKHLPHPHLVVDELLRVLKPGGRLVLGTPDYGRWEWPLIERVYDRVVSGGHAHEHVTRLTRRDILSLVDRAGADFLAEDTILHAEWVGLFRKR